MIFSKATPEQFQELCTLYQQVIRAMESRGLKQWAWDVYPTREQVEADVDAGRLYRAEENGALAAVFALTAEDTPEYAQIAWQYGVRPAGLHRLAVAESFFGAQTLEAVLSYAKEQALSLGYDCLRLDACTEDEDMAAFYRQHIPMEAEERHSDAEAILTEQKNGRCLIRKNIRCRWMDRRYSNLLCARCRE